MIRAAAGALVLTLGVCAAWTPTAQAGWLTKILRQAGDGAGGAGRHADLPAGFGALGDAAHHIRGITALERGVPLAAHVTPEGHWKFANKNGEVFTAANAEEMKRMLPSLAPGAAPDAKVSLYLTEETVFEGRALLKDLPPGIDLFLVDGSRSYRLLRRADSDRELLYAVLRPNLVVEAVDRQMFHEAAYHLNRPLNKSNIRVLAIETGGPKRLSSVPGFDPASKAALVDPIDPAHLEAAMSSLRGQSAVLTGRVENGVLHAGESSIALDKLYRAAEAQDVNLIVLQSQATRQPGGRNWLYQKVEVAGLDDALKRATFGDFLDALGASRGELAISAVPSGQGRITLRAVPTGDAAQPLTGQVGNWLGEAVSHVTGEVITKAVEVQARDQPAQTEQDLRILPWLPSIVHLVYFLLFLPGLFCIPVTWDWWQRVWPREAREDYKGALGYWAARCMRGLAYVLLFMPVAAVPALPVMAWRIIWGWLTLPGRVLRWIFRQFRPSPT